MVSLTDELEKFLKRRTEHYVNLYLNQTFNTKPLKNPSYIRFSNQQRTEGYNSDGQLVKVANLVNNPIQGGMGYLIQGTNTYSVVGPVLEQVIVDGNPENAYVLYAQGSPQTFFVQKNDDGEKFFITNLLTPVANTVAKFAVSGNHILLYVFNGSTGTTQHIKWQIIKNFTLSGGVCSGTVTTGVVNLSSLFSPIPDVPPVAPANADYFHNPIFDTFTYSSSIVVGTKIRLVVDESGNNAYFLGNVKSTRTRDGLYSKLTAPFTLQQVQTTRATLVRFRYNTATDDIERFEDGTKNGDWNWATLDQDFTYAGNWALNYPEFFTDIYYGKNGTSASLFTAQFPPFIDPNIYYWIPDWFSLTPATPSFVFPIAFTDVLYVTAPTPFNSSTVKPTNSHEFLTYVTDTKLTRYREVDGSYVTKDFPIFNELSGIERDYTVI